MTHSAVPAHLSTKSYDGSADFKQRIQALQAIAHTGLLQEIQRGVEKESLRVTPEGYIAQTPHPSSLGSALAHPYITTDYSEALMEFITPPVSSPEQVIDWLYDLHAFTYQHIGNEMLWPSSMPCTLSPEKDIPIANYGTSAIGQMKHIYREGLAYRYGKAMQIIAGIHFNFSFSDGFWQQYQTLLDDHQSLRDFKDQQYFNMMRNFLRYAWFIVLLFGASPAICRSFLKTPAPDALQTMSENTLFAPQGTSLRMSDLGYQNRKQSSFSVSYNHLQEYINDIQRAVDTLEPDYVKFGSVLDGKNTQLTPNILQIEAEYYSPIRAKCVPHPNERPTHALQKRGVEYIEVRVIDLDPFEPVGINPMQIRFLESFLLMCLLEPSAPFTEQNKQENKANLLAVAYNGRNYNTLITQDQQTSTIAEKATGLWQKIESCAQLLDQHHAHTLYQAATKLMQEKYHHPEQLTSTRVLRKLEAFDQCNYFHFSQHYALQHQKIFQHHKLSSATSALFMDLAKHSLQKQDADERDSKESLLNYLKKYLGIK